MAPKVARRPAGAGVPAGRRLRRPAAAEGKGGGKGELKRLSQLALEELKSLDTVFFTDALYYGRVVELCGVVKGVRFAGPELILDVKALGTTDDGLLRAVTAEESRAMEVHVCSEDCGALLTGALLVHGRHYERVNKGDKPWFCNMEAVVPPEAEVDELRGLREAAAVGVPRREPEEVEKDSREKEEKKDKKKERRDKKEKSGKKVKKGEGSQGSQAVEEERGKKDLAAVFAGAGLDPDLKKRLKMLRRARKIGKKKKKKKKSSGSSSTSSSTGSATASSSGEEALFSTSKRVKKIWLRYPGALTAGSVKEAKERLLTSSGSLWSEDRKTLPPLFVHYARTNLLGTGVSPPLAQEILTLSMALDLGMQGKIAASLDVLSQRLKALETLTQGSHWTVARQHELCRLDQGGIAEENESREAARLAREEERLRAQVTKGGSGGKGQDSGKSRKGKEGKSPGKGKGDDGNKGKGGDGKKEDQSWQKKK